MNDQSEKKQQDTKGKEKSSKGSDSTAKISYKRGRDENDDATAAERKRLKAKEYYARYAEKIKRDPKKAAEARLKRKDNKAAY